MFITVSVSLSFGATEQPLKLKLYSFFFFMTQKKKSFVLFMQKTFHNDGYVKDADMKP